MNDRQLRTVATLSLILIALAGVLIVWSPKEPGTDDKATARVLDVDEDAATAITVEGTKGALAFEKRDDTWWMTSPFEERAEAWKVKDILGKVGKAELGRPVPGDAAKFGLGEPPKGKITLTVAGQPVTLVVGAAAPIAGRTYVRAADGSAALVTADLAGLLAADAGDYRDHRVLDFKAPDVATVVLAGPGGGIRARRDGTMWWVDTFPGASVSAALADFEGLTPAVTLRGDPMSVEEAASYALDLRYDAFADAAAAPIGEPTSVFVAALANGAKATVRVGQTDEKGARVEASDGRGGWVVPDGVKSFGQGPTDLAEKSAFVVSSDTATAVKVSLGGTAWDVAREATDKPWRRAGADDPKAADAVAAFSRAKFVYQPGPPPELGAVWGTIEVVDGARSVIYEVGALDGDHRIVRDTRGGSPYRVAASEVDAIRNFWGS